MEKDKLIELIFNLYKDEVVSIQKFRKEISKKYKLSDIEITNIYAKINNYQIKKYGGKRETGKFIETLTRKECQKRAASIRTLKYKRRNKEN